MIKGKIGRGWAVCEPVDEGIKELSAICAVTVDIAGVEVLAAAVGAVYWRKGKAGGKRDERKFGGEITKRNNFRTPQHRKGRQNTKYLSYSPLHPVRG